MLHSKKIRALNQEISRLEKAKQSDLARHIDVANLMDAKEKLRQLEAEAKATAEELRK